MQIAKITNPKNHVSQIESRFEICSQINVMRIGRERHRVMSWCDKFNAASFASRITSRDESGSRRLPICELARQIGPIYEINLISYIRPFVSVISYFYIATFAILRSAVFNESWIGIMPISIYLLHVIYTCACTLAIVFWVCYTKTTDYYYSTIQ